MGAQQGRRGESREQDSRATLTLGISRNSKSLAYQVGPGERCGGWKQSEPVPVICECLAQKVGLLS